MFFVNLDVGCTLAIEHCSMKFKNHVATVLLAEM